MKFLDQNILPLGMGCWPIGGEMYSGRQSLGYTGVDDKTSLRTIDAAFAGGIRLFDTAAAYGAGHSEHLLGLALGNRPEAMIVTKIGIGINENTRQLAFGSYTPDMVEPSVEGSLRRLKRDRIDMILLHLNDLPVSEAEQIFSQLDKMILAEKVGSYGWSTDYSERAASMASRENFRAIEFAKNVFFDAWRMQSLVDESDLHALIRSPLAMGLLSGKYDSKATTPKNDIRSSGEDWMEYFQKGRANPTLLKTLDFIRELLKFEGRTLIQGALGWLWAQSDRNIPIPGARTPAQIEEIALAQDWGPLPKPIIAEIETFIERDRNAPDRPR